MAVPPQIQVPPPTKVQVFQDCFNCLPTKYATVKDKQIFIMIKGSAFAPNPKI